MPSGGHCFTRHDVKRSDIKHWEQDPSLKCEDGRDKAKDYHAASSPHDLDAKHEEPRKGTADPFDSVQSAEDDSTDADGLF